MMRETIGPEGIHHMTRPLLFQPMTRSEPIEIRPGRWVATFRDGKGGGGVVWGQSAAEVAEKMERQLRA